jgi:hypothetical protein
MTDPENSNRGAAAAWLALGLALIIPVVVLLGFMRGLTSVWRTKWESPGRADSRYEIGAQSRVSMPTAAPVATPTPPAAEAPASSEAPSPVAAPAPSGSAAPPALQILTVTSPVERGGEATVEASAPANALCSIEYRLPGSGNVSSAQGLEAKTANANGRVSWTWAVGRGTTPGEGSVSVQYGDETVSATIEVM